MSQIFHVCSDCNKKVSSLSRLEQHKKSCPKCHDCGNIYSNLTYLKKHKCVTEIPKPKCDKCKKEYSSISYLKKHKCITLTEKVNNLTCEECGKCYSNKTYLKIHNCVVTKVNKEKTGCTLEHIKKFKDLYTRDIYNKYIHGLVDFIKLMTTINDKMSYVCKDVNRHKFYRCVNNKWIEDNGGNFIKDILYQLKDKAKSYFVEIAKEYDDETNIIKPTLDQINKSQLFTSVIMCPYSSENDFGRIRNALGIALKVSKFPII